MWFHVVVFWELLMLLIENVSARFCEGGHICSLPRECCTQGCCPPYQGGPRQLPPPSEHVLNLFFISHWFFWCVVVAVILAILCAYSLWKKRRTLCGWGFTEHHTQSEGDSAGSCYAPPQYSRCNSFHHPPPPYTEVTSKPDLYPLVFTCNSDNGKNGSSYLMVQYFRNYIVRPAGSLSAASTVDSLSSSFICNANEANTLVPPPYSRAASPDLSYSPGAGAGVGAHYQLQLQTANQPPLTPAPTQAGCRQLMQAGPQQQQQQQQQSVQTHPYILPRSASQLVCAQQDIHHQVGGSINIAAQQVYQQQQQQQRASAHYATMMVNGCTAGGAGGGGSMGGGVGGIGSAGVGVGHECATFSTRLPCSVSGNFTPDNSSEISRRGSQFDSNGGPRAHGNFIQSQSDQHFRYTAANSNSSISDIFVNGSCAAGIGGGGSGSGGGSDIGIGIGDGSHMAHSSIDDTGMDGSDEVTQQQRNIVALSLSSLSATTGGTPVIFSNGCIKPNPLHRANTNPTQFTESTNCTQPDAVYNSSNSIGGISITVPTSGAGAVAAGAGAGAANDASAAKAANAVSDEAEFRDLQLLRRSLETCCQLLQQQQQQQQQQQRQQHQHQHQHPQQQPAPTQLSDSSLQLQELAKKYAEETSGGMRSYMTSGTVSGVSSLLNIGTPNSPPQATSPTGDVKEILDQIHQLQAGVSCDELMSNTTGVKPKLHHTLSSPTPPTRYAKCGAVEPLVPTAASLHRYASICIADPDRQQPNAGASARATTSAAAAAAPLTLDQQDKRPSSFQPQQKQQQQQQQQQSQSQHTTLPNKSKKFFTPKPNKAMYIPMITNGATPPPNRCVLKSPVSSVVGANFFVARGRSRIGWISRSAPTTPGTGLPPNRFGDDSPLLHEHDEDAEGEQNAEFE